MNRELARAYDRARQARVDAELATYDTLSRFFETDIRFSYWTQAIRDDYSSQWCLEPRRQDGGWKWDEIGSGRLEPRDQIIAVKSGDRLAALSYIKASRERVKIEIVEADPRRDCPLHGKRLAIILEFAVMYGQRLGCKEIHIAPVNEALHTLYVEDYGFEEVTKRKRLEYIKKDLG